MRAILIQPTEPGSQKLEEELMIEVPAAPVDDPSRYEPESLYPAVLNFPVLCSSCAVIHVAVYPRQGFRMHDDGPIAVYKFKEVLT